MPYVFTGSKVLIVLEVIRRGIPTFFCGEKKKKLSEWFASFLKRSTLKGKSIVFRFRVDSFSEGLVVFHFYILVYLRMH